MMLILRPTYIPELGLISRHNTRLNKFIRNCKLRCCICLTLCSPILWYCVKDFLGTEFWKILLHIQIQKFWLLGLFGFWIFSIASHLKGSTSCQERDMFPLRLWGLRGNFQGVLKKELIKFLFENLVERKHMQDRGVACQS